MSVSQEVSRGRGKGSGHRCGRWTTRADLPPKAAQTSVSQSQEGGEELEARDADEGQRALSLRRRFSLRRIYWFRKERLGDWGGL